MTAEPIASGMTIDGATLMVQSNNNIAINMSQATVSRSIVTATNQQGFQISTSQPAVVSYSISISTTATIGGTSSGNVYLEIAATNSTTPSDWTAIGQIGNGQTISLAVALQSIQLITGQLMGCVPAGYYARIRSNNVSGTPIYTYMNGQEVLM